MSDVVDVSMESCCANCGAESGDAVKLKNCTACRLVKYCGVDCQKAHRGQHRGELCLCTRGVRGSFAMRPGPLPESPSDYSMR